MIDFQQKEAIMDQLHKRFSIEQVKVLLQGYLQGTLARSEVEEMLQINKTRSFELLKEYRQDPEGFSIEYERATPAPEVEAAIQEELLREKALVEDPKLPIWDYNYSALRDRLRKKGMMVSATTIIQRAKALDCYLPHPKKKVPEPSLGDAHPDALAWGSYQGLETLAWLEVESGKKSRKQTIRDIMYRYDRACSIAEAYDLQTVFVVLAQPWVLRSLQKGIRFSIPSNMAIVFENWRNAGYLCRPVFGDSSSLMGDKDYPYIQNITKMLKKQSDFLLSKVSSKVVDEPPNEDLDLD